MSEKLTKPQLAVLDRLANPPRIRPSGAYSRESLGTTAVLLGRLEKLGFIESAKPFASSYHTVRITDAGRAALRLAREGGSNAE